MRKLLSLLMVPVLCAFALTGCTAAQGAQTADSVIKGILAVAQDEEAALPASDAAIMAPWVSLGQTLEGQLASCISGATSGGSKSSAFVGCFNTFASGLLNPTELAQLRIMTAKSQSHVQLVVTTIAIAVNGAFTAYNAATQTAPVITAAPSTAELQDFRESVENKMGLPDGALASYGGF